ncbi:MAG: sn-glycerol-3-phosphate ABC transporter substrate-binding protein UgpB [Burkholderiales bacterium]|nr:sn-glycerol-3-phosphate ABC transporter substrate-binding protein UgpB [Burkholderiales bacterium]
MSFRPTPARGLVFAALFGLAGAASAATDIQFWHSMTGALGDRVVSIADRFNKSQSDYKIVPVYKGSYPESMTAAIAAYRAKQAPHIVQVFEVGTATMMYSKGAIKPVYQLMADSGQKFDPKAYISAVYGYYATPDGKLLSMPFNSSTPVFYINKDAFQKAGLDPNDPPKTWAAVAAAAAKLKVSGEKCGFTFGWPSWTQLENFSAWHNLPFATKQNGFGGLDARLAINGPLQVRHIGNLKAWMDKGYVTYAGRTNEAESKFYSGECGMLMSSSGAFANISRNAKFKFGVSQMPYYPDIPGAPQNSIIGGASLWVLSGHKADDYKGVAKFFAFLSNPEIQAEWHQATGYLPITYAAYELTKKSGFYDKTPGPNVAVEQMIVKTTSNSRGIRLGNFVQVRNVIEEELEAVWTGKKQPKQALDDAVKRGDEILVKFQQANK